MSNVKCWWSSANGDGYGFKNVCNNSPIKPARFLRKRRPLTLRTELGLVILTVDYGQDPHTQKWYCPQQQAWGLMPQQKITPGLAEKLCFTAVASTSYELAAAVASRWGVVVDDAIIHQPVQRAGERADQQAQARIIANAAPPPPEAVSPGALVIMMDGWMLRHRGEDWGNKPADASGQRVAWQECKNAVIYRLAQAAQMGNGRGLLVAEARWRGLGTVPRVYVVADAGVWIWNIVTDRLAAATGVLDFYHASQHLWELAHALHPEDEAGARAWSNRSSTRCATAAKRRVPNLAGLAGLVGAAGAAGAVTAPVGGQETNYFETHRAHLH